ncbi:uncharacterized protein LOC110700026 isoform X2 [Chenopodium quinoa]|uniref:uncharacterized protein LOC110700026 isoform X2 n=1 Tax=Chenopodium quinoa TaxID=63459 RepID=UPI000B77B0C3|nr:uncharacterized protein LOC110700026 isoform X2 [Chenopodium quinoa]XP_021733210.1 uncharacterized protein LOC110700026 isoform X2 [Chenopodium quinoa]
MASSQSKRAPIYSSDQTAHTLSDASNNTNIDLLRQSLPPDKTLTEGRKYLVRTKTKRKAEYWKNYIEYLDDDGKLRAESLKFQKVFGGVSLPDGEGVKDNEKPPDHDDWVKVGRLVLFLEEFYHLTRNVSSSLYVKSNKGLFDIAYVYDFLNEWEKSDDLNFQAMAISMKKKFDKYWGKVANMNMFIHVASILDHQSKFRIVEEILSDMYGEEKGTRLGVKVKQFTYSLFE